MHVISDGKAQWGARQTLALVGFCLLFSRGARLVSADDRPAVGPRAYVSNSVSHTVSAIDASTHQVVATLQGLNGPMAVSPDGRRLYVADGRANDLAVIDTADSRELIRVKLGNPPTARQDRFLLALAVSPDSARIYVTQYDFGKLTVINAADNQVVADIKVGRQPGAIVASPDGERVYVASYVDSTVSVLDTGNYAVIDALSVDGVTDMTISPDSKRLYAIGIETDSVTVINTADNRIIDTLAVGQHPIGSTLSRDGSRLYVPHLDGASYLDVIDSTTHQVQTTAEVGERSWSVAFSPDGKRLYVNAYLSDRVTVISTADNQVVATVPVPGAAWLAMTPDGKWVYVISEGDSVTVINTADNTVETTIAVDEDPRGLVVKP